jgi:hypothetical protein
MIIHENLQEKHDVKYDDKQSRKHHPADYARASVAKDKQNQGYDGKRDDKDCLGSGASRLPTFPFAQDARNTG